MKKYLLISNAYPTQEKVYANGFLHRRVKSYEARGLNITVIVITTRVLKDKYYDGVHIKYMDEHEIRSHLITNEYETVMFHFVNPKMFYGVTTLEKASRPKIVVWLHGFEAEAWHRRYYNFLGDSRSLDAQLNRRETVYEPQRQFLKSIMTDSSYDITFIYVSEAFKTLYVDPFVGVVPEKYHIIPNIVDGDLFPYRKKEAADVKNICSIRPYVSKNYANDITAEVIMRLSKKKYFKTLTFNLYGDGPLFDSVTAPLKQFSNVHLHKGFVNQNDIPEIHSRHGVFLCPSRHDSQGVSIGEAMASGLVPVSNAIGGIPEFVPEGTGKLAGRDNVDEMVALYDDLYRHPKQFLKMSENASAYIRKKAGVETVIDQEIEVITGE